MDDDDGDDQRKGQRKEDGDLGAVTAEGDDVIVGRDGALSQQRAYAAWPLLHTYSIHAVEFPPLSCVLIDN